MESFAETIIISFYVCVYNVITNVDSHIKTYSHANNRQMQEKLKLL